MKSFYFSELVLKKNFFLSRISKIGPKIEIYVVVIVVNSRGKNWNDSLIFEVIVKESTRWNLKKPKNKRVTEKCAKHLFSNSELATPTIFKYIMVNY